MADGSEGEDEDLVRINLRGVVKDPSMDMGEMADLLLSDDSDFMSDIVVPGISTAEVVDILENKPVDPPLVTPPLVEKPLVKNSPSKALSLSMAKGNVLQKCVGNPIENDALVDAVRNESSVTSLLNVLMEEMAEEAAFIKAWRNQNWNGDVDLSEATSKRIKMLKDLSDTLVEREKLKKDKNVGKIDFYGENFQRVLKYFLEVIQKTFKKVNIPAQFEDIFFTQLAKEFDGFEKSAEKIYYGKE
jgi:hypothetical protein